MPSAGSILRERAAPLNRTGEAQDFIRERQPVGIKRRTILTRFKKRAFPKLKAAERGISSGFKRFEIEKRRARGMPITKRKRVYYDSRGNLVGRDSPQRIKFGRGRPRGAYDPRYARFGGVYGFRKWQSTQNQIAKLEALRNSRVTPQEQAYLQQQMYSRQQQQIAPENQIFPDTKGFVRLKSIHDQITDAANEVP